MLMIDIGENVFTCKIEGSTPQYALAELTILVETVQEKVKDLDVYGALNDPMQKALARAYLKEIRGNNAEKKEPERQTDGAENKD